MIDRHEFFRDKSPDEKALARAEWLLQRNGWLPANEPTLAGSETLLVRFLGDPATTDISPLVAAACEWTTRGQPDFPHSDQTWDEPDIAQRSAAYPPTSQLIWVDPQRIFPNRKYKDKGDWTRIEDQALEPRDSPALGLAEFARRIAHERGDPGGLKELLGPGGEAAHIDLDGWDTPLGAFFRINANGNHRAAAFAILGAPCVPATVQWNPGPYSASWSTNSERDEVLCAYRILLHCYGVASYPDPGSIITNSDQILSEWPFLIDSPETAARSLPLLEQVAHRRHDAQIGRLSRDLFDDADALISAGRRTRRALEQNRRKIERRGVRSLLETLRSGR